MGLNGFHGTRRVRRGRSLLPTRQPPGDSVYSNDSELVQEDPPDPKRATSGYGMIGMPLGTLGLQQLQPARSRLNALKLM